MIKNLKQFIMELIDNRRIIFSMAKKEFVNEYAGSAFGVLWGMLKPFITVVAYWFVFTFGFRSSGVDNVPYIAWLIPGLFAWTFVSDGLINGTGSIRNNAHLVKKVVFPISILPTVKILVCVFNHLIFMAIAMILLLLMGIPFHIGMIQIAYYMLAGIIFTIAITRLLSTMAVMSIDVMHLISTITQLLFWMTPVIWSPEQVGEKSTLILNLVKLNPYFYIVQGYRDSLFTNTYFWQDVPYLLYFWGITILLFVIGSAYYAKNRKDFADVL